MKAIIALTLLLCFFGQRGAAQTPSFADTLTMLTRTWKLASVERSADTALRADVLHDYVVKFNRDLTYATSQGSTKIEQGVWAIDREHKLLLSMPDNKPSSAVTIVKLTSTEFKVLLEINDDKIWLTMIPSVNN